MKITQVETFILRNDLERIGLEWFEEPLPQVWPSQAEYAGMTR